MKHALNKNRCAHAIYDGWEGLDRCLRYRGHQGPHNFVNPKTPLQKARFKLDTQTFRLAGMSLPMWD